jgi:hypothetical protein
VLPLAQTVPTFDERISDAVACDRTHRRHVDATALRVVPAQEVVTAVVEGRRVPLLRFKLRYPDALPAAGEPSPR